MPQIVLGANRGGDWPGAGLPDWRPTRRLARKSLAGIPRRVETSETGTEEWLPPELLALLTWEPRGEPWKPSCDTPAGTLDNRPLGSSGSPEWGSWGQYQKDSGAGRKRAISRPLGGWPMEGVFFSYGVCPSDSDSPDRVVPRNFTAGSGSNGCNNFPTGDRPPPSPPPPRLLL